MIDGAGQPDDGGPGQRGSMFLLPVPRLRPDGSPAETYAVAAGNADFFRGDAFGQTLRAVVPSRLKPSDIDFASRALGLLDRWKRKP